MDSSGLFLPISSPKYQGTIASLTVARAGGENLSLDPAQTRVEIQEEHPPMERMSDDWGAAICEAFTSASFFYLKLSGVALAAGDRVTITYSDRPHSLLLKVIELENGRVRIDPPQAQK